MSDEGGLRRLDRCGTLLDISTYNHRGDAMAKADNRFSFRLDRAFHKDLRRKALEEDVNLAEITRALLQMWLQGEIDTPEPEPLRSETTQEE
jgi:hypothetical protein